MAVATSARIRMLALALLLGVAGTGSPVAGASGAAAAAVACTGAVAGDVNGDGQAEVAIADGNRSGAGSVHVLYGEPAGLVADARGTALDDQHLSQETAGVPGTNEPEDGFGRTLLLRDLTGDGCADLVVGVPGEDEYRGRVLIFTGSPAGLRTTGVQVLDEESLLGGGDDAPGTRFGAALATGDFDDDGLADLAVGAPGQQVGGQPSGAVVVLPGTADGGPGSSRPAVVLSQDTPGVPGAPEFSDSFGDSLAAADFDGRGSVDLAVGVPDENGHGTVTVLRGSSGTGLTGAGATSVSPNSPGVPGTGERRDAFGAALAAGDVDRDGRAELAIGVPGENRDEREEEDGYDGAGAVVVLPGSPTGPTSAGSQLWNQNSAGVAGVPGFYDRFGWVLTMAPLDGDRYPDLAVSAPYDEVSGNRFAGSVTLLRGSRNGLTTAGSGGTRVTPDSRGITGSSADGGFFGYSLAAAPVRSGRAWTLVVGAPARSTDDDPAGVVHQLATGSAGPTGVGSRAFTHRTPGVKGEPGSRFGLALSGGAGLG